MKVLIGCSSYPPYVKGGGEISTQLLAEGLHEKDCDVAVLSVSDSQSHEVDSLNGIRVHRIPPPNVYWSYQSQKKSAGKKMLWHLIESYNWLSEKNIDRVIKEEEPDIFHTSTIEDISPYAWKVSNKRGVPAVHTLRSYNLLCPFRNMFRNGELCKNQCWECKLFSKIKKCLTGYVSGVQAISNFVYEKHKSSGLFKNSEKYVIPNIYDSHCGVNSNGEDGVTQFGYIGRLHRTKGVHRLIEEGKGLLKTGQATLSIAGTGSDTYVRQLKNMAVGEPIDFLGYTEPSDFYSHVDVVVVPSLWSEPFGRVIVEAFAHGCPVVAARRGGIPELISPDVGWLFEPTEKGELAKIMKSIISKPTIVENKIKRCKEKSKKFGENNVIDKTIKMYQDMI